jgi:hypothetical protein
VRHITGCGINLALLLRGVLRSVAIGGKP